MTPESDTKERILETAFDLFSSKGYNGVSLNEIVSMAGVSKGGLFHHFNSKYDLGRECLMWFARKHMEPEFMKYVTNEMAPEEVLIHFVDFMFAVTKKEDGFTKFFWSIFDEAMKTQNDQGIWIDFLDQYVEMVSSVYSKMGVKDPYMKALLLLSNLDGMALYFSMLKQAGKEIDMDALRDEFIRTYVTFDEEVKQ